MTWFRWWHKHARVLLAPKSVYVAELWTKRLSLLYGFLAWNAAGLVIVYIYKKSNPTIKELSEEEKEKLTPGQIRAIEEGREKARIIRLSGLKLAVINPGPTKSTE
ncbi:hypothetical protein ABEB36_003397 [Hypothenemus hampei]|uniref:Uncharacterized protein n=1 Tax=Hypothenemus hampei TaxID=57062 RepID=A0ABD1F905_HYPHA